MSSQIAASKVPRIGLPLPSIKGSRGFLAKGGVTLLLWVLRRRPYCRAARAAELDAVRRLDSRRRFIEMAGLSLGVAALSYLTGLLMRTFLGVDV
jgi:hypothetical protein